MSTKCELSEIIVTRKETDTTHPLIRTMDSSYNNLEEEGKRGLYTHHISRDIIQVYNNGNKP